MGYSLVGVYPCAVLKPETTTSTTTTTTVGPVRISNRHTNLHPQPYPSQSVTLNKPTEHQRLTTSNLAQPAQIVVTSCTCGKNNNTPAVATTPTEVQGSATATPMLFVPFNVPNFAPPMAATTLQSNCSPSKVNYVDMLIFMHHGYLIYFLPRIQIIVQLFCSFSFKLLA